MNTFEKDKKEVYRLELSEMSKSFPGVKALDNVNLKVRAGSVHAIIGENGAGKSTLMKCLFGIYQPDFGTIKIDGKIVSIPNSKSALDHGMSMIHQELNPIPYRNIIDNIWVGRFVRKGIVVDEKELYKKTLNLLSELDITLDPTLLAKDLSVSQLQAIEIAKAVSYNSKIIIMDEPTSSLTIAETKKLFNLIDKLKLANISIIYISHKLEEIYEIADEVTVLRDGKYINTWKIEEVNINGLISQMVGRDMKERFPTKNNELSYDKDPILRVESLTSAEPHSFRDISFELHRGEILGIGGLVGAKRTELVESIFGLRKIKSGKIYLDEKQITISKPSQAIFYKIALLTEERRTSGIIPMLSVIDNVLVCSYRKIVRNFLRIIDPKKMKRQSDIVCKSLNVKMASPEVLIKFLSGGNQQKVLVGRWLLANCDILILDEPTRGVDIGAKYEIYKIMLDLVERGKAIIMVSSEMPELIGMSDRILVMCEGHLTGILRKEEANQIEIMNLATKFASK